MNASMLPVEALELHQLRVGDYGVLKFTPAPESLLAYSSYPATYLGMDGARACFWMHEGMYLWRCPPSGYTRLGTGNRKVTFQLRARLENADGNAHGNVGGE